MVHYLCPYECIIFETKHLIWQIIKNWKKSSESEVKSHELVISSVNSHIAFVLLVNFPIKKFNSIIWIPEEDIQP